MEHLAELESMLFTSELEATGDEDEHAAGGTRRLAVDGGDCVLALLERESGELRYDALRSLDLLTFKSQHGSVLIQVRQSRTVRIERRVVVLDKRLRYVVWVHGGNRCVVSVNFLFAIRFWLCLRATL